MFNGSSDQVEHFEEMPAPVRVGAECFIGHNPNLNENMQRCNKLHRLQKPPPWGGRGLAFFQNAGVGGIRLFLNGRPE
jgi:hypothetical protein